MRSFRETGTLNAGRHAHAAGCQWGQKMDEYIHWLGHAAVRSTRNQVIYIAPFRSDGGPIADLRLLTHSHYDHGSPKDDRL